MSAMALGLSHSLSRYRLKFSPDKVDTMIVQAICKLKEERRLFFPVFFKFICRSRYTIFFFFSLNKALLDDLDKELNIYAMRVREWYGWHFPEMG